MTFNLKKLKFASLMNIHTVLFDYLIEVFLKEKYVSNYSFFFFLSWQISKCMQYD